MQIIEKRAQKINLDLKDKGILRNLYPQNSDIRLNLASNDYLGVVKRGLLNPYLKKYSIKCATGGMSSRLVFGTTFFHNQLEEKLADYFGYDKALVFTSGFMANYGLCAAIKELADAVIIDKRVHASIVDGLLREGKPLFKSYKHNDCKHYKIISAQYKNHAIVTITESLFSMTGKICLYEIIDEASKIGFTVVDEAHSLGAVNPGGKPIFGKIGGADITVGTFGKAFGCAGGFILCSDDMHTFLINRCRSFIFSTAIPEIYAALAIESLDMISKMDEEREKLKALSIYLSKELKISGFKITGDAHIIAIYCKGEKEVLKASELLSEKKIALYGVRPPTVPPKETLLRISLNATLDEKDLDFFLENLCKIRKNNPFLL